MKYLGIDAKYTFTLPDILCPCPQHISERLNVNLKKVKKWVSDGELPALSQSSDYHTPFWTMDEAKEAYIKGFILLKKYG